MRITNKSVYFNYLGNLENIQNSKMKEETRLSTGKQITGIEEDPEKIGEIKNLQSKISKNEGFMNIMEQTMFEMSAAMESMDFISNSIKNIRQTALDSIQPGVSTNLTSFASQIKSMLQDIIGQANSEYNGRTLYSGTATNPASLTVDPADAPYSDSNLPFELISVPPDAQNPSGLKVIFKGNNNDRLINRDANTTEVTNVKSKDVFGDGYEPKLFEDIIKLYNIISFNADGSARGDEDNITKSDIEAIDTLQKSLLAHDTKITNTNAMFGSKYNRLDSLSQLILNENMRLSELKSIKSDADIARTTISLRMEETALQYSLQVGARIMQNSLFDFLR